MKAELPCRFKTGLTALLILVTFFVTNGQTCIDSRTLNPNTLQPTAVACAGDNLLWQTTTIGATAGEGITWTIIADTSGGAVFVASGLTTYVTTSNGAINTALVHLGPNAGTVTVRMSFNATPELGTCSSSGIAKILTVQGNAPPVRCHDDLTTITAINFGTIIINGAPPINLPGDCGTYTFTLNPLGVSNNTGVFNNIAPGNYTITIRDCAGCQATSGNINIVNPPVVPVTAICAQNYEASACQFADQAAVNTAFQTWLEGFGSSGGTGTITEVFEPAIPQAPNACGGFTTVTLRVTDECGETNSCTATFTVLAPPAVIGDAPDPVVINFCDINPGTLAAQFQAFLDGFTAVGGCDPQITFDPHGTPNICGGPAIIVRAVVRDKCMQDIVLVSTFDVRAGNAPQVTPGSDVNLGACLTQGEIDAAFGALIASVTAVGDCGPLDIQVQGQAPTRCDGGTVPVTFTINPRCLDPIVIVRQFVVATPTAPTLVCAPDATIDCNASFNHTPPTPSGGCGNLTVNIISTVVSPDGLVSTRTWDVTDECGRHSAQCSQVLTKIPCPELNGCTLGYWKNHTKAWDCYSTCTLYNSVFTGSTMPANLTLLQALNLGGNTGCENLARQSVAALLNICEGLPYGVATIAELQAQVNAAFANGTCVSLGAQLDAFNNEGGVNHCDVPKSPNTSAPSPGCNGGRIGGTDFKIAPNPTKGDFKLFTPDSTNVKLNIIVYDMTGRVVDQRTINTKDGEVRFGNDYPMGMYTVIIEGTEGQQTLKIVKQ